VRRRDDALLDAGDAHQLQRAQLEIPGARVDGRAAVLLHRQAADAVQTQEHRGGKSHQAAADDQDGNVFLGTERVGILRHACSVGTACGRGKINVGNARDKRRA
jgi:hypothetical protein